MMRRRGNSGASLAIGDNFVIVRNGYEEPASGGDPVFDYAVVIVYGDSTPEQRKSDRRYRIHGDRVELTVGKRRIDDIRGTNKLYVIRGDDLQIYDVPCTSALIKALIKSQADGVDQYISEALGAAETT